MTRRPSKRWLWAWDGVFFGYRDGDNLWTHDGRHIGQFHGDEIYDPNGGYLGEVQRLARLIVDLGKRRQRQPPFFPQTRHEAERPRAPTIALPLPPDHLEFPSP